MGLLLCREVLSAVKLFAAAVAAKREREAREWSEDMFLMDVGVMGGVFACEVPMVERELCGERGGLCIPSFSSRTRDTASYKNFERVVPTGGGVQAVNPFARARDQADSVAAVAEPMSSTVEGPRVRIW